MINSQLSINNTAIGIGHPFNLSCSIDYAQIYNQIAKYPVMIHWILIFSAISFIIYMYLPMIKQYRNWKHREITDRGFFSTGFILLGLAIFEMIPMIYNLTNETISKLNTVLYILAGISIIGILIYFRKEIRDLWNNGRSGGSE